MKYTLLLFFLYSCSQPAPKGIHGVYRNSELISRTVVVNTIPLDSLQLLIDKSSLRLIYINGYESSGFKRYHLNNILCSDTNAGAILEFRNGQELIDSIFVLSYMGTPTYDDYFYEYKFRQLDSCFIQGIKQFVTVKNH
jgi:hypothetical protein